MTKAQYKAYLKELMQEDPYLTRGNPGEEIYIIDNIHLYGGFDYGSRGYDHNYLICHGMCWEDLLKWGIVVVPEERTYIADKKNSYLESIGYDQLPLNRNHIVGY